MKITFEYATPDDFFDAIQHKIVQVNNLGNAAIKKELTGGDLEVQNAFDALCADVIDHLTQASQVFKT